MKEHVKRSIVHKNGLPIRVMRPTSEEVRQKAIQVATKAATEDASRLSTLDEGLVCLPHGTDDQPGDFAEFMDEVGADNYLFVGYLKLGDKGIIVDENGKKVGRIQPGDSFVGLRK